MGSPLQVISTFIEENKSKIIFSGTINIENLTEEELELVATIAGSCILNGPVGVNKVVVWTTPSGKQRECSIKQLLNCGSSAWKNLCYEIAKRIGDIDCQSKKAWGNYWPMCEINGQLPNRFQN